VNRVERKDKVTGRVRYAGESSSTGGPAAESAAYAFPVQAAIARGSVSSVDISAAIGMRGVRAILSCMDPPPLGSADDAELAARRRPSSASVVPAGSGFVVRIAAADIGTGARTALTLIAAECLDVAPDRVQVEVGDSSLPDAWLAGGSMGTASWGSAVVAACEDLLKNGVEGVADTTGEIAAEFAGTRSARSSLR
jgi:CO/xanthine dehydrogenase Mo-binding subunit